jgi:hypothetical protein
VHGACRRRYAASANTAGEARARRHGLSANREQAPLPATPPEQAHNTATPKHHGPGARSQSPTPPDPLAVPYARDHQTPPAVATVSCSCTATLPRPTPRPAGSAGHAHGRDGPVATTSTDLAAWHRSRRGSRTVDTLSRAERQRRGRSPRARMHAGHCAGIALSVSCQCSGVKGRRRFRFPVPGNAGRDSDKGYCTYDVYECSI